MTDSSNAATTTHDGRNGVVRLWITRHPLTLAVATTLLAVNLIMYIYCALRLHTAVLPQSRLSFQSLASGQWYRVPLSLITIRPSRLMLELPLLIVATTLAESRIGRVKTAWVSLISTLGGLAAGMGLFAALTHHNRLWAIVSHHGTILGPLPLAIGSMMCASAFGSVLWRRRIRVIGYAIILALFLYRAEAGDAVLLCTAMLGHLLGYLMADEHTSYPSISHGTLTETRRLLAFATAVQAVGPIIAVCSRQPVGPLSALGLLVGPNTLDFDHVVACLQEPHAHNCFAQYQLLRVSMPSNWVTAILPAAALLLIAWGLYHGKRVAAWLCIVFNSATIVLTGLFYIAYPWYLDHSLSSLFRHGAIHAWGACAVMPAMSIAALAMLMRYFDRRTEPSVLARNGITVLFASAVLLMGYTLYGTQSAHAFTPRPSTTDLMVDFLQRVLPIGAFAPVEPLFIPTTRTAWLVHQSLPLALWIIVLWAIRQCLIDAHDMHDAEHRHADQIIAMGGESMSFMATWQGNQYWFSASGRSAIAYRVSHGVALTITGPFGDPNEWDDDLRQFCTFCASNSWTPAFYSIHAHQRDWLASQGWHSLAVGTEMVVDPNQWHTTGKRWQDVRTAINKAKREGITDVMTTYREAPFNVQVQIRDIAEQWVGEKALPEMKFTLGGLEELGDPRVRLLYAVDAEGTVIGVTSWLPTWRDGHIIGWTLDFMRHRTDSFNGVMELLIARMAERLRDEGTVEFMSLSAAPLAGTDDEQPDDTMSMALRAMLRTMANILEPAYGFHSLYRFKRKFQPAQETVYIAYPDAAKLPQLSLAVVQAYLPTMKPADAMRLLRTLRPHPTPPSKNQQSQSQQDTTAM